MATAEIDLPYLSSYLTFPEESLHSLLSSPTVDLVTSLLQSVAGKAREHEQIKSEKLKLDVELENVVRAADSRARVLRSSVEKGLKDVADLRQKLQDEETSRQSLESRLHSLNSSTISSTSEIAALHVRIESLESSNRNTLSLLESKSRACDDLTTELSVKHQKVIELRHEVSALEQTARSAAAAASTAKYREQTLQSEIDTLKRNGDWLDHELKTRSAEYNKFRRDKNARVAELVRSNEEATTSIEMLQRSEISLKQRLDEANQKSEEFLNQIQQLRDEAARSEENFRSELDTSNRLAELLKNSLNTERHRQQDLSAQLEQVKEEAAEEIGRINAEIQTEHQDRMAAERRVAELEIQIERLETDNTMQEKPLTRPGTPASLVNGNSSETPVRNSSRSRLFSPSLSRIGGGLSMTQMITDYHNAKAEVQAEKKRNEKLSATIDEMIQEMESRQPEVAELQADHDRLEADVLEMSSLVDSISSERDQARKEARKWEGEVAGLMRESDILRQQLRDLSSQVKVLLLEVHGRNQGLDNYTPDERRRLEQLARGDIDAAHVSATDRFISEQLTTFKDVSALQEQNTKLLRIAHELGYKLEGEEAQRKKTQASQNEEELETLRQKYERCRDEMKSLVTQSQSYIRERDMFRRMLAHRGQLPPGSDPASMFGESIDASGLPATPSRNNNVSKSIEQSPASKDMADYAKLLKEMQAHFDSYRQEAATDRSTLKVQVENLSKKNAELRSEFSRKNNEATLAHERYEMLQANYGMLKDENSELQKRTQVLSERAATQDIRTQQVAEDLIEAKGILESARNELANLKAEKEFWKSVEKRLTDDNSNLVVERDRLNTLNIDLQNIMNERDQSDREARRRLESQIEAMDAEMQATKRKLNEEIEENKRTALRREYESKQSQTRIDDLITSLGSVREELVAAKTTRDHLQARVDDISIELRSAEERLHVLKPQSQSNDEGNVSSTDSHSENQSREQQYALQVSELTRDLELAQAELASAKAQVEQYKTISQSSEEELQSLNETQDQYRQEMDSIIEEKETKIRELEHTLDDLRSQISNTNAQLLSLQTEVDENSRKREELKAAHEAELAKLKDLHEQSQSAAHFYQEDLKLQAEIARQAQQNYDNELMKHADATKALQKVRGEYNQLRLDVAELKAEAESARRTLSQSEESWSETTERYERELMELRTRRDDVQAQNKLLHQQLENVSNQIASLQQKRTSGLEDEDNTAMTLSTTDTMQELVQYLRREKEIVDVQWELSSQEAKRLRQQLEHTQTQLDEARLKLNQQRRAEENSERSALTHNKLMETINELNLNRESNVTLRLEKNQAQASLAEKLKIIEELQEQIQPLHAKIRELEDEKEAQAEELRMTREARERFEQRYHDVLHKSDSIDPAEFETLKEQVANLENECNELKATKQALQEQVDNIPNQIKQSQDQANERFAETRQRLVDQSKAKARDQNTRIREKDVALQGAAQEKQDLERQLQEKQQELEAVKLARDEALAARNVVPKETAKEVQLSGSEDGQVDEVENTERNSTELLALQEKADAATLKAIQEAARSTQLQDEANSLRSRVTELQSQIDVLQRSLEQANEEVRRLQSLQPAVLHGQSSASEMDSDSNDQFEKLRQDLLQAQNDAEALRATASITTSAAAVLAQEGLPSVTEQIAAQVSAIRVELTARHDERIRQAEATFQKRADIMKAQLSKRLAEGRAEVRQAVESLKAQHEQELQSLEIRHRDELDELRRHETARFEQFKQSWLAENANAGSTDASTVNIGSQPQLTDKKWEPSEAEIRNLISSNELVKTIMKKNITALFNKDREALIAKTREEQQKVMSEKIAEVEAKATQIREQAVVMEGKKYNVKISMTENRARVAQAKVDFVQKAATDTPEKPVGEVWQVAKDAKPASVASQQPQPPIVRPAPSVIGNPFAKPTPSGPSQSSPIQGNFGKATPNISQPAVPSSQSGSAPGQAGGMTSSTTSGSDSNTVVATNETAPPQAVAATNGEHLEAGGQQTSTLPDKVLQGPELQRVSPAPGPTSSRNQQQSNLPLPSGGRGGFVPGMPGATNLQHQGGGAFVGRGRGRGIGRGGLPQVQTAAPNNGQQSQNSPRGGPMSATAKQFVPQAHKRARDDGLEASQHANSSKRVRGGGQGI